MEQPTVLHMTAHWQPTIQTSTESIFVLELTSHGALRLLAHLRLLLTFYVGRPSRPNQGTKRGTKVSGSSAALQRRRRAVLYICRGNGQVFYSLQCRKRRRSTPIESLGNRSTSAACRSSTSRTDRLSVIYTHARRVLVALSGRSSETFELISQH